jgi:Ca2+-transporting ATPase
MQVVAIETLHEHVDVRTGVTIDHNAEQVLQAALAASELQPFDPMERGIHATARLLIPADTQRLQGMHLIREYDLTPDLLAVTHVWQMPGEQAAFVAVKGAPETVMELCRLDFAARDVLMDRVNANARRGLRILGVARGNAVTDALPDSPRGFDLSFLGFVCLADPLRADVPTTLAECKQAGIRVVMITGDYPGTALAIATQAGFDTSAGVLTGAEVERMNEAELMHRAREVNVYARAKPEHKLRLVQAFKSDGQEVAMTGDGVNDAPALKAAHVGVAMGGRGTDVAREAAALVLVNDDFASLVAAVRLGRRIYTNIRHAMSYIVSVHIPIAGMGLLPVLFGWPLLLFPVHVLFLEFVIDPTCAFVFEADPESPDTMRRPPRARTAPLFSGPMLKRSIGLGACVLLVAVIVYGLALRQLDDSSARALVFVCLVFANLALIFVSRSRDGNIGRIMSRHNNIYWGVTILASIALALAIYLPSVAAVFKFSPPDWQAVVVVALGTVLLVLITGRWLKYRA